MIGKITDDNTDIKESSILVIKDNEYEAFKEGFLGYIFEGNSLPEKLKKYLVEKKIHFVSGININGIESQDIVNLNSDKNSFKILYKGNSAEQIILTTNQCNNNCIMCPDSDGIRKTRHNADTNALITAIKLMDNNTKFICITGGEPTLLKQDLFEILDACTNSFNKAEFIMLTNGRTFYYENYIREFIKHSPNNMIIGIPLHSHKKEIHDNITRANGSYIQTVSGIKNLLKYKQLVEIRVVINKLNYLDLVNIAEMISTEFLDCHRVNFMAMEILGNAYINLDEVWVDFEEFKEQLEKACMILLSKGIRSYIYNIPLCYIDKKFWSITKRSITEYKVRYGEECEGCKAKEKCGGFFFSTKKFKNLKGIGIV
jgi:His-Xaa-Ser repeat-associated downstream radical SAM protein